MEGEGAVGTQEGDLAVVVTQDLLRGGGRWGSRVSAVLLAEHLVKVFVVSCTVSPCVYMLQSPPPRHINTRPYLEVHHLSVQVSVKLE